ncbi:transposase family protein [Micromonospora sp. NPDC005206]|uniref:transposase family protein n=1 Tax=Micromonospora sp. NPDC005206 TaxID=3157022 RepID=UPI0033BA45C6
MHVLTGVPDPRDPRGVRYPLAGLLTVAVCAVLAGASSFAAITDWLHDLDEQARARLGFTRGVPVGTAVWRLLTRLDAGLLATVLAGWLRTGSQPFTPWRRRWTAAPGSCSPRSPSRRSRTRSPPSRRC